MSSWDGLPHIMMSRTAYQRHPHWHFTGNTSAFCSQFFKEVFIVIYMLAGKAHGKESHKRSNVHKRITIKCPFHTSCLFLNSPCSWKIVVVFWQMTCILYSAEKIGSWLSRDKSRWIIAKHRHLGSDLLHSFIHWAEACWSLVNHVCNQSRLIPFSYLGMI